MKQDALGRSFLVFNLTRRVGGILLLLTIGSVVVLHGVSGSFRADPLVYAAGIWFVMVHGSAHAAAVHGEPGQ